MERTLTRGASTWTECWIEFETEITYALVLLGQGRMERALTHGASLEGDLAAVLVGLRETRTEVEAALVSDPEAARKLATEGAHATIEVPLPKLLLLLDGGGLSFLSIFDRWWLPSWSGSREVSTAYASLAMLLSKLRSRCRLTFVFISPSLVSGDLSSHALTCRTAQECFAVVYECEIPSLMDDI